MFLIWWSTEQHFIWPLLHVNYSTTLCKSPLGDYLILKLNRYFQLLSCWTTDFIYCHWLVLFGTVPLILYQIFFGSLISVIISSLIPLWVSFLLTIWSTAFFFVLSPLFFPLFFPPGQIHSFSYLYVYKTWFIHSNKTTLLR